MITVRAITFTIIGVMGLSIGCAVPAPAAQPATNTAPAEASVGHEVGDRIPNFEMSLADGSEVTSAALLNEDKPVFLFFMATW